ncbi:MAG: SDR family NAD(P)-dependent oxidoreductase [Actinomycetota bacterium]
MSDTAMTGPSSPLHGRVALVTGGARSIGAAIADRLAADGAMVVVGDLVDSVVHHTIRLDVADEASVLAAIEQIAATNGRLDIVVNNAGIMFETPIAGQDLDGWNRMVAVNLTGPMLVIREAAPHLAAGGVGSIINIGSLEGDACNPRHAAYAATKAGVHGLTRAAAIDLGPSGVRCNAIAPGWIDTPLNADYVDVHPARDTVIDELAALHPIGRVGTPSDVADVAAWLAGDRAAFVTGQVITVDGGRTARPSLPPSLA